MGKWLAINLYVGNCPTKLSETNSNFNFQVHKQEMGQMWWK